MKIANKIIAAAQQQLEESLLPEVRENFEKILVAGMRAGLHGGVNGILAQLGNSKDPINDCAIGAVNLVMILRGRSRGTMPDNALAPAAMALMLQALDFADKSGIVKVGKDEMVRATRTFFNRIFAAFKITTPMLNKMAGSVGGVMNDPAKLEAINRRAGTVKDPRASTQTMLPDSAAGDAPQA